jgi:opacity protein-like surface antigen
MTPLFAATAILISVGAPSTTPSAPAHSLETRAFETRTFETRTFETRTWSEARRIEHASLLAAYQDPAPTYSPMRRNGGYIQFGFGTTTTSDSDGPDEDVDFDEGYAVPLAFGRRTHAEDGNGVALDWELEALWTDQDTDDPDGPIQAVVDVTVLGALINAIGVFALSDALSLYAGGGAGAAFMDIGTESDALNDFDDEDGPFLTWQAKAGLRWYSSPRTSWSLGYRFVNIDDVEIDDDVGDASFDLETEQHVLELGVRFSH